MPWSRWKVLMTAMRVEFRVDGRMSPADRVAFADLRISEIPLQTVLDGDIVDQSHLDGVIIALQALGITVVSVQRIPD